MSCSPWIRPVHYEPQRAMADLHAAAHSGVADVKEQILLASPIQQDKKRLVETCDMDGNTGLYAAAAKGRADIVEQIFLASPTQQDKQRLVETCDKDGRNALHAAARGGSTDVVEQILLAYPTQQDKQRLVETCDIGGNNALHAAAAKGNADVVKQILLAYPAQQDKQRLVETCDILGNNALHAAARSRSADIVEQILLAYPTQQEKQRLVATSNKYGSNGLHAAARSGSADVVKHMFLAYPTQQDKQRLVETCDQDGNNALHAAAAKGSADVVKQILLAYPTQQDKQRLVEACDILGNNALHAAARGGSAAVVEQILLAYPTQKDKQRLVETCDKYGRNALHAAARSGRTDVVEQILLAYPTQQDKQRLVETCNKAGSNVIDYLSCFGETSLLDQLLNSCPLINRQNLLEKFSQFGNVLTMRAQRGLLSEHDICTSSVQALGAADDLGNTVLHYTVFHDPIKALVACAQGFQAGDAAQLLAARNRQGLCPVDMLHCDAEFLGHEMLSLTRLSSLQDHDVGIIIHDNAVKLMCQTMLKATRQIHQQSAHHAAYKLSNFIQSCYYVPMHVAGVTERVCIGSALIMSNTFRENSDGFCGNKGLFRDGWEREQQFVVDAMELLNVQYEVHNDATACEMVQIVESFASRADKPVTFFFIMSHGKESTLVLGNDGKEVCIGDLVRAADVRNLKGLPKLFFVQACRGEQKPNDVDMSELLAMWSSSGAAQSSNTLCTSGTSLLGGDPETAAEGVAHHAEVFSEVVEEEHEPEASAAFNSQIRQLEMEEPAKATATVTNSPVAPGGQQNRAVMTNEQTNQQPAVPQNAPHTAGMLNTSSSVGPPANRRRTTQVELPKDVLLCQCTLSTDMARRGAFMEILSQCLVEFANGEMSIDEVLNQVSWRLGNKVQGQCPERRSTLRKSLKLRK